MRSKFGDIINLTVDLYNASSIWMLPLYQLHHGTATVSSVVTWHGSKVVYSFYYWYKLSSLAYLNELFRSACFYWVAQTSTDLKKALPVTLFYPVLYPVLVRATTLFTIFLDIFLRVWRSYYLIFLRYNDIVSYHCLQHWRRRATPTWYDIYATCSLQLLMFVLVFKSVHFILIRRSIPVSPSWCNTRRRTFEIYGLIRQPFQVLH